MLECLKDEYNGYYHIIKSSDSIVIRKESLKDRTEIKTIEVPWNEVTVGYIKTKRKERLNRLGFDTESYTTYKKSKELNPRNVIKVIFEHLEELKNEN